MSDAAAFFASKKKSKKKAFKFNANKIDAATVTTTVHVDAPALSTNTEVAAVVIGLAGTSIAENDTNNHASTANSKSNETSTEDQALSPGGQWDDEALAASYARKGAATTGTTAEVLDMKAFDAKRRDQDDIKERMRVEETKAQLQAAREGMEREAQRLKEQKEKGQEQVTKPETGRTAMGSGMAGGIKWVPPHMRSGGGLQRVRMGGSAFDSQKLDTQDASLFPDLAVADQILEKQKEHDGVAYKVQKKTPVGGGATWGSRTPVKISKKSSEPQPKLPEKEPEVTAPAPAPPVEKKKATLKPTKKKKKDLSTFKPSSS
mmetsp:Transcript_12497/g.18343  ORF Transcript_12497/g.18343 Transcript_12497/m.18343 type:complete len:319 (-) Transcript_12497:127-1083(-)|eukprot:CAMPEP_0194201792 /NCGR_PEP_ID=MMETSP0156-20130528/1971_1 /TAXON_ID=33649 /ORGANISM="Thalassionema nitzschioides, Strain L26-B" /LENGTH=318 /DNA_ID=CAMNT_0038927085 /DNA_START=80 /DNA_END=1036 /DNA_ORIENTATION=-